MTSPNFKIQDLITEPSVPVSSGNGQTPNTSTCKSTEIKFPSPCHKEFVSPYLKDGSGPTKNVPNAVKEIKPRYNPSTPSALVMPRPPTDIQVFSLFFNQFELMANKVFSGKNLSMAQ